MSYECIHGNNAYFRCSDCEREKAICPDCHRPKDSGKGWHMPYGRRGCSI